MKNYIIFSILFYTFGLNAQAPLRFCTSFGGNGIDIGYKVIETFNKQYVIIGSTTSYGSGFPDAYLIVSDSMGQGVRQKNYGGSLSEVGKSILLNPSDSGFVFVGYSNSEGSGDYDIFVVRTDKLGNPIWEKTIGGSDWDFGNDLVLAADGNVVVCGTTLNGPFGKSDGRVIKLDILNGSLIWNKTFGGNDEDEFNCISLTSDLKLTIIGNTKSYGDLNGDFWVFKLNDSGDSLTSSILGNLNKNERVYDFIEDATNNLVMCGSYDTSSNNSGKFISYIIKSSLNGIFVNDKKISGAYTDEDKFYSIAENNLSGKYFLSRKVNHFGTGFGIDVQPYLMDFDYTFNNATTYGGIGEDEAFDVINTSDNGFAMVGYTKGDNFISEDVYLIKLDQTLLNAEVIVNLNEIKPSYKNENLYYFDGKVYIKDISMINFSYEIISSQGVIVQYGLITDSFIEINEVLNSNLYYFRIKNKGFSGIKFIK